MAGPTLVDSFELHRRHLLSAAYHLTGSVCDAEDAVQESWLRLARTDPARIRDLRGWLTRVVARICLDRLRSAPVRRELCVGSSLPEPTGPGPVSPTVVDPLETVVRQEESSLAARVMFDALPPERRIALVLHDGFGVPFEEIATALSVSVGSARQLASRARRAVADARPRGPGTEHADAAARLVTAMEHGDVAAVLAACGGVRRSGSGSDHRPPPLPRGPGRPRPN